MGKGLLLSAGLWLASRVVVIALVAEQPRLASDVNYWVVSFSGGHGAGDTMTEYPVPAYLLLWPVWALTRSFGGVPAVAYLGFLLLVDAVVHVALIAARRTGRAPGAAEWAWIALGPALGAVSLAHFDVATGGLVAGALLLLRSRPRAAGVLAALATGVKYWPAIVLPGVVLASPRRRGIAVATAVTGVLLAVGSAAIGGVDGLWSPLVWQADRGLQIEAVAAIPAMVGVAVAPDRYDVHFTDHLAYEVTGPGVSVALAVTVAGSLALSVLLLALWWRGRRGLTVDATVWVTLTSITGFIAVDKVFSPQYLLWATPVAAAGLALVADRRPLVWWTVGLTTVCVLTQAGPVLDLRALVTDGDPRTGITVAVLTARNLLLVALVACAGARAWRLTGYPELSVARLRSWATQGP